MCSPSQSGYIYALLNWGPLGWSAFAPQRIKSIPSTYKQGRCKDRLEHRGTAPRRVDLLCWEALPEPEPDRPGPLNINCTSGSSHLAPCRRLEIGNLQTRLSRPFDHHPCTCCSSSDIPSHFSLEYSRRQTTRYYCSQTMFPSITRPKQEEQRAITSSRASQGSRSSGRTHAIEMDIPLP